MCEKMDSGQFIQKLDELIASDGYEGVLKLIKNPTVDYKSSWEKFLDSLTLCYCSQ